MGSKVWGIMTPSDVEHIERLIASLGLYGFDGDCGLAAIAINERVFGGEGTFVAGLDARYLGSSPPRYVGHVAVLWGGCCWDALGALTETELLGYGAEEPVLITFKSADDILRIHERQWE
jgi:hypothetical protein